MSARRQRGLALVSVLWGISILSLIAAAMLAASVTAARVDRNVWNAARAGAVADAVARRAILSLMDDRPARQPRVDSIAIQTAFDGAPARLWIQDESGRINLNFADALLLKGLFVSAGLHDSDADALAQRIVARRAPQNATGTPPPLAFHDLDELLSLPGMTPGLFARTAPALTVYGKNGVVDQTTAPPVVLRALPGMTPQAIADLLKSRNEQAATAAIAGTAPVSRSSGAYALTVEVHAGNARVVRTAAVQFTGDPTNPYLVLDWR